MSSVQENPRKRTFFRSDSLEKLRCSYPIQLAGTLCSNESTRILLKQVILSGKKLIQKPILVVSLPVTNLLCAIFTIFLNQLDKILKFTNNGFTKFQNVVAKADNKTRKQTYSVQKEIKKRLELLQHLQSLKHSTKAETTDDKINSLEIRNEENVGQEEFFDCKDSEDEEREIFRIKMLTVLSYCQKTREPVSRFQKYLPLFVYTSTIFVYLQLMTLIVLLNNSRIPLGLVFLIACILFICFLVFKISFMRKIVATKRLMKANNYAKTLETIPEVKLEHKEDQKVRPVLPVRPTVRQSRSRDIPEYKDTKKPFTNKAEKSN